MIQWQCLLELNAKRQVVSGDYASLAAAIGRAGDLRIGTQFLHNEHIDVESSSPEKILEVAEFGVTYRLDQQWVAGVMSLRQPIELPSKFGPRPSMSFFLYNQDGTQGIARPFLDGKTASAVPGPSEIEPPEKMPKYHVLNAWDEGTNAPCQNFIYDFDGFRFCVSDTWQEVLHHSATGETLSGKLSDLVDAFSQGCSIKLGVENLCSSVIADASPGSFTEAPDASPQSHLPHEVFVQGGSAYYYTEQKLLIIGTHPVIRIAPQIPLRYCSRQWDFGWLMVRTDGHVVYRRCDPYSLAFTDHVLRCGVRWFVR